MSRIFNDSYERLIARIDRPDRSGSNNSKATTDNAFGRLLADIDKSNKSITLNRAADAVPGAKGQTEPPLSNLSFREKVGITSPTISDIKAPTASLAPEKTPLRSVKELETSVKTSPVAPEPALPPKAPDLIYGVWKTEKRTPDPIRLGHNDIRKVITSAGKYHGIDPELSMAVAKAESAFDSSAISSDGHHSKGLFQLLDSTGKEMMQRLGMKERYDPFDPAQNSFVGTGYLRRLHDLFSKGTVLKGDLSTHPASSAADLEKLAVAAFNAGEGNVARAQNRAMALGKDPTRYDSIEAYLPAQTQAYVGRVLEYRHAFVSDKGISTKA